MSDDPSQDASSSQFYPAYSEFSKTVRTWFVGFGIGGPVVLMANERAWPAIVASGCSRDIGWLFLIGGAFQVLCALLNKHSMWYLYFAEDDSTDTADEKERKQQFRETRLYRLANWYSEQNWFDVLFDTYSLIAFSWGIILAVHILAPPAGTKFIRHVDESTSCYSIVPVVAGSLFVARLIWALRSKKTS